MAATYKGLFRRAALVWVWAAGGTLAAVGFALAVSSQPAALSVLNLFTVALAIVAVAQELWLRRTGRPRTDPALVTAAVCLVVGGSLLRHAATGDEVYDSILVVLLGATFAAGGVFYFFKTDNRRRDAVLFRTGVVLLVLALADLAVGLVVDSEAQNDTVLLGLPLAVVWLALTALRKRVAP